MIFQMTSTQTNRPKAIRIAIGYGWMEHGNNPSGLNEHWAFLRDEVRGVIEIVTKEAVKRAKAQFPLKVVYSRLRARHGMGVLGGVLKRIEEADILIFDISGHNANVLFELGYAIAVKGADSGRIFIFKEETLGKPTPSDLKAYMLTLYDLIPSTTSKFRSKKKQKSKKFAKVQDVRGFQGALRGAIKELAQEKGMWGLSKATLEFEEE